jgi:hypothetical protein
MKGVDIIIQLDRMTVETLVDCFMQLRHCNPRHVDLPAHIMQDEVVTEKINEYDKDQPIRNKIDGEILRRGVKMHKPFKMPFADLMSYIDNTLKWFAYKQSALKELNEKAPEQFKFMTQANLDGFNVYLKKLTELKGFMMYKFVGGEEPRMDYITWFKHPEQTNYLNSEEE